MDSSHPGCSPWSTRAESWDGVGPPTRAGHSPFGGGNRGKGKSRAGVLGVGTMLVNSRKKKAQVLPILLFTIASQQFPCRCSRSRRSLSILASSSSFLCTRCLLVQSTSRDNGGHCLLADGGNPGLCADSSPVSSFWTTLVVEGRCPKAYPAGIIRCASRWPQGMYYHVVVSVVGRSRIVEMV